MRRAARCPTRCELLAALLLAACGGDGSQPIVQSAPAAAPAGTDVADARTPLRRGDVVVFEHPCTPEAKLVQRIVALGGDSVEVRCSLLYINGAAVANELLADGAQCDGCSRYRERLGEVTYDILDDPDRPQGAGAQSDHDFPEVVRGRATMPGCGPRFDPVGTIEIVASSRKCDSQARFVVPDGTVFVLGDNRVMSSDSRMWGPVPETAILGIVAMESSD